ncbi:MAG: polyprenyl synthetase family protein [Deltaproteobacteria bacterium]|nr:polyprenyl synthetase family protein [Deltaproteobacteria bacterium]
MMNTEIPNLALFEDHFEKINQELNKVFDSRVPLVEEIGKYALLGQGKRLRPLFFILSCQLCDYQGDDLYSLSTVFEYIHTSSLLHDDVLDNAEIRRRKPSSNQIWGNQAAVLEGDFLFSKSLSIAVSANSIPFISRLTEATMHMSEGQILELVHTENLETGRDDYMQIITAKTAVLISAACGGGAIISGTSEEEENDLTRFGQSVGIAFQLVDDLLDYTSSEEVFGKPVGKDLLEGKITLPLIYTLAELEPGEKKRFGELFKKRTVDKAAYQELLERVRHGGVLEKIREEAQRYVDDAAMCLKRFPDSAVKENLLTLIQYIIHRTY